MLRLALALVAGAMALEPWNPTGLNLNGWPLLELALLAGVNNRG